MSALLINLQYGLTIRLADELCDQAGKIKSTSDSDINGIKNAIAANWKGENSIKYIAKLEILEGKIATNARELDRSGAAIRTMAENIRRSELRAIEIAKRFGG